MQNSASDNEADAARQRIRKKLETLVEERTALGEAFEAYVKGTLTSSDCSTLVDLVLRQFVEDAKVSPRNVALLEVVADAVAQVANREAVR
jgi:hypothetical protein